MLPQFSLQGELPQYLPHLVFCLLYVVMQYIAFARSKMNLCVILIKSIVEKRLPKKYITSS